MPFHPLLRRLAASALVLALVANVAQGSEAAAAPDADQLVSQANSAGKYALLCLWKGDAAETTAFRKGFAEAAAKEAQRAVALEVQVDAPASAALIKRLELDRAPTPLVIAIAANGAITRGFPQIPAEGFGEAFVGPALAASVKALQDGRTVVIMATNPALADAATTASTKAFVQADAAKRALVTFDPTAAADADIGKALRLTEVTATTVILMMPPGRMLCTLTAPVTIEQLDASLTKAQSGGCGPGGCGPGGCR
jgi:hypothetical protein